MLRYPIAALFLGVLSAYVQSSTDTAQFIVSELRAGRYSEATANLGEMLKKSPNDAQLWTLKGFALLHLGQRKEALESYNRAIELSPDYLPALEGAAEIEYADSDQRAVPLLERILTIQPQDETTHAMLASLAFKRGDCDHAVTEFGSSRSVIGSQVNALEEYGSCLVRLKRIEQAIEIFQRLRDEQSDSEKARYNLAVVQSLAGRYRDVIATLTPPANHVPDSDSLDLLAEAYEALSQTPLAVAALRQAIVTNPDSPRYYLDFANICLTHSSFQVGIDMLNAGLKRMPEAASLYLARGILYIQLGEYDNSERDFGRAEQLDPRVQFGSAAQGLAELQRNDLAQADATIRTRLSKNPNDAFLHYLLAETLTRKGAVVGTTQFSEAVKSAETAVKLQPNFPLARDVLGRLYLEERKTGQAIEQSRLAFQEDPTDQTALYHLIVALRKGGKTEEIPKLAKQLADVREQARAKEAAEHKYSLIEVRPEEK